MFSTLVDVDMWITKSGGPKTAAVFINIYIFRRL